MGGIVPPAERRSSILLGLFATASLVLLVTGDRIPTASLRAIGAFVFSPLDRVVLLADRMAAAWRENRTLQARVATLELDNQRLRLAGAENRALREQLGLPSLFSLPLKPVEVLALAGEPIPTAAVVSAGTRHGVRAGDVLVTRDGLLGRIGESYPLQARATLLTDPNSAVACEIESTGVLGVLRFSMSPHPHLTLTGVPLADTVRLGQRVLTSGLSRRYPRGVPVGTVSRVGKDAGLLTQDVEVEPAVQIARLRLAFVTPQRVSMDGATAREGAP